ncbi:hypothetical protein VTN02DRAFT_1927 [Thermoascus thermophilus]
MALPEMTYSPAYSHHDHNHDRAVAVPPYASSLSTVPAVHLPLKYQQPSYGPFRSPASGASSPELASSLSDDYSSTASYSIPKTCVEHAPAVPAAAFMLSSRAEAGSISSITSKGSGDAHKEDRSRASWASYTSAGVNPPSAPSAHSRLSVYAAVQGGALPDEDQGSNALLMLLHLSISVPIFSTAAGLYTIFSLLFVVLSSPLRLCPPTPFFRSTSFATQLCQLLVPPLHFQERLVRRREPSSHRQRSPPGSPTRRKHNDPYRPAPLSLTESYSAGALISVHLLSPFLSLGLLLAAWTAASFWVFAVIVGNPDGTERRDDGRAAVLGVGSWWRRWLAKARRTPL